MKDLPFLENEGGQYLSFLKSEKENFQVFVDESSRGSGTHVCGLR